MDLSKLTKWHLLDSTHEIKAGGVVTNVYLEVEVAHADCDAPCRFGQYLNERTAEWTKGGKPRQAVIFDNVITAFDQLCKQLAVPVQEAASLSTQLKTALAQLTPEDVAEHYAAKEEL